MEEVNINQSLNELEAICGKYLSSWVEIKMQKSKFPQCDISGLFCKTVTVKCDSCSEKSLFDENSCPPGEDSGKVVLHGNYFGPFRPEVFMRNQLRIVVLLKEDYITVDSFKHGDRGGRKKSSEFCDADSLRENMTYWNLVKVVNSIAGSSNNNEDVAFFLDHTAIINVSPFPGISCCSQSKRSDDKEIEKWAKESHEIIQKQIEILKPAIVFSGNVLKYFLSEKQLFAKLRKETINSDSYGSVFGRSLKKCRIVSGTHDIGIYTDELETVWVDDNHPSRLKGEHLVDLSQIEEFKVRNHVVSQ